MSSYQYQYEALLREPVEYWAAAAYAIGVAFMVILPEAMLMPPVIAYVGAGVFAYRGSVRFRQARKLSRYQKQLINLPSFTMSSHTIGYSNQTLWLGKGFWWDERHTQRLYDIEQNKNRHFREMPQMWQRVRRFEQRAEHIKALHFLTRFTQSNSVFNPWKPLPDVGGSPQLHSVGMWEDEQDVRLNLSERVGHTLVLGTTRVGKTRLAEVLIGQDIRRGDVTIVIDPKGDGDLLLRCYVECQNAGRVDDFHIFHLGYPDISDSYNPLGSFMRITEVATRVSGQMPGEGQSATFREFVWGYVNAVAAALIAMGKVPDFDLLKKHSANLEGIFVEYMEWLFERKADRGWKDVLAYTMKQLAIEKKENRDREFNKFTIVKEMWTRSHRTIALYKYYQEHTSLHDNTGRNLADRIAYDTNHMNKLIASLQPFLDKMTTGKVAELLLPAHGNSQRKAFNWNDIIQKGGVVYVGLDALSDPEVASAIGNSMFSDLTSIAGRLYKTGHNYGLPPSQTQDTTKRKICLHADEFNELIGDEFIPMLNKAGGAGIQVTAYTQTSSDVAARLGSNFKAAQVFGNFNTKIFLRVLDLDTANLLTKGLKKVQVVSVDVISGAVDSSNADESGTTFTSSAQQRQTKQTVDLLSANELLQLPKGQAFALLNGGKLAKIRMPLPSKEDFNGAPKNLKEIATQMNKGLRSAITDFKFVDYMNPHALAQELLRDDGYGAHPHRENNDGGVTGANTARLATFDQVTHDNVMHDHVTNDVVTNDTNQADGGYGAGYGGHDTDAQVHDAQVHDAHDQTDPMNYG